MEFFQKGCTLEFDLGQQVDGYELAGIVLRRVMQRPNKIKTFQLQKERSNSLSPQFGMKSRGWMALRLVYRYLFPSPPHQSIATSKSLCAAQTFEFLHLHCPTHSSDHNNTGRIQNFDIKKHYFAVAYPRSKCLESRIFWRDRRRQSWLSLQNP